MRRRASSLALAGVLILSGGALAVANTPTAEPTATPLSATPDSSPTTTGSDDAETRTPPGWENKAEKQAEKDARKSERQDAKDATAEAKPGRGNGKANGIRNGRGPDATGPAAHGLCRAWANQQDPAAKAKHVPPFRNLAAAAGGVDKVVAYCAELPERPSDDPDDD